MQADRGRDGEIVHETAEGGAFLVHVDEDFTERTVLEFPRMQVDFVAPDRGLLDIAFAAVRQARAGGNTIVGRPASHRVIRGISLRSDLFGEGDNVVHAFADIVRSRGSEANQLDRQTGLQRGFRHVQAAPAADGHGHAAAERLGAGRGKSDLGFRRCPDLKAAISHDLSGCVAVFAGNRLLGRLDVFAGKPDR